jgi:membrane-bound lytic murein transglycosylase A
VTGRPFSTFINSPAAPLAVAAFIGFAAGLLFAALFFPPRIERVEVEVEVEVPVPPAPEPPSVLPDETAAIYAPTEFETLANWMSDSVSDALPALLAACSIFDGQNDAEPVGPSGLGGTVADWRTPCAALATVQPGDDDSVRALLRDFFVPYAVSAPDTADGTFTGYYEASLNGALTRSEKYNVPLYAPPRDLVELDRRAFDLPPQMPQVIGRVDGRRLIPYDDRAAIENTEAFADRAEVLAWVDDPVDAHLLHIQGSGRVRLPDGSERRIGYAANNGLRFRGIGGILLTAGELGPGQGSMPSVADWLRANPDASRRYMAQNPRYIFFRWIDGPGPIGAMGAPLTPRRSLAVDPRYIPYGAPLWLDTVDPDGEPLERLMVALDTGSAIRGVVRGDFFWGAGAQAFAKAGRMKSTGRYALFLPRTVAPPAQAQ